MTVDETTASGRSTIAVPVADPSSPAPTEPGTPVSQGRAGGASRSSTRLVVLLGVLSAFSPLAIDMYLPAFPQIERDLSAPAGTVPLTLSLFLAGLAFGQLACGPIADRVGRRRPLLAGCFGFAAAALLCAFARSIEALIAARFLMGLSGAAGLVIARAIVRDLFNETDSARIFSMMMLVTGVAPVVAPTLGGQLLVYWHWHAIFWVLAGIGLACGVAVAIDLRESLPPDRRARGSLFEVPRQYGSMLIDPRFVGYALAIGCASGLLFAYITGSPFAFMQLHGISPRSFGVYFASNAIGMFGAAQLNRWLLRHFGSHAILKRAFAVNAASGLLLVLFAATGLGGFAAFFAALFACMTTLGLILPNATAAALVPFARQAGTASALLGMLQYALGAAGGAAVGLLHNGTALPMAGTVSCCGLVGCMVVSVSERRRARAVSH
jgi:DHA1 family bicyclomycin/chloramphenicol resistance-like MFS transporter